MDPDRARELLARERTRLELALAPLGSDARLEDDLRRELAALERAEARLAEGTYGLSVESGEPIPDQRLEAVPTAERTIEEEEHYRRT